MRVTRLDTHASGAHTRRVQPGEVPVVAVRVFGETDMSQDYRVAADGTIDFPYLPRVRVQGLAPTQIADVLREQLRARGVLRTPQVSVFVRELASRRVVVTGQVSHQGNVAYEPSMTIVHAISAAGGFTASAQQSEVRLTRRARSGGQRTYVIPVDAILDGRAANVPIAPNDLIHVPERF